MTNRETMQQALEALDIADNIALVGAAYTPKSIDAGLRKIRDSATALREALEREHAMHDLARLGQEIEQEPQAEPCIGKDPRCPCQDGDACHYKDCGDTKALPVPVPPEQEPVAFYHPRSGFYWAKPTSIFAPTSVDVEPLPLYAAVERNT